MYCLSMPRLGITAILVDHIRLSIVVTGVPKYTPPGHGGSGGAIPPYQLSLLVCYNTLTLEANS